MIITENHPKKDFEQRNIETQVKISSSNNWAQDYKWYLWTVLEVRQNAGFNLPWTGISSRSWEEE